MRRQKLVLRQELVRGSHRTGPSGFSGFRTEEALKNHRARNNTRTSLVSYRTRAKPEEGDPADDSTEAEGGSC
jgi:hypothetical protein